MRVVTILIYIQSYSPIGCIRRFYKEKPPPERGNISCRRRGASGIARGDLQSNVFMRASCRFLPGRFLLLSVQIQQTAMQGLTPI